jgi:hypothetical protein
VGFLGKSIFCLLSPFLHRIPERESVCVLCLLCVSILRSESRAPANYFLENSYGDTTPLRSGPVIDSTSAIHFDRRESQICLCVRHDSGKFRAEYGYQEILRTSYFGPPGNGKSNNVLSAQPSGMEFTCAEIKSTLHLGQSGAGEGRGEGRNQVLRTRKT